MPSTVAHVTGMTKDEEFQEYYRLLSRLLLKQGIDLADVPRVEDPRTRKRWLFVWPTEQEALDFAARLNEQTKSADWEVREVDAPPSLGPLRPLEIEVGRHRHGWTFALAPWTRKAIQTRFPGSCQSNSVSIAADTRADFVTTQGGLDHVAKQMLLVLTGLTAEQLQDYESYVLRDPVSGEVLLAPTLIQP